MGEKKFNFTKKTLEALEPSATGAVYYHDTGVKGLTLRVTAGGAKTFVLYRKINGRPERITLGRFPDMTIEQARGRASQANAAIASGENPADVTREAKRELTLEELFQAFLTRYAKAHKRSWQGDQEQFDRYLTHWKNRKLTAIKREDVQALHARIGQENGPYAANRLVALLSAMFGKAVEWGLWSGGNPTVGITKFKEKSRERFLQGDELPRFFKAVAEEPNETARDYFLVSLLTGARRANVQAMRWDQISFERSEWRIVDTKNGDPITIPLVGHVVDILKTRKDASQGNEWVFPGHGVTGHLVEPKTAWARILERAGIEDLRIHDLRRSLGSWQAMTGASLAIIGKSLGHKNVTTTMIYSRLNIDPVRASVGTAVDAMLKAGGIGGGKAENVIPLRREG
ncbi:MAG: tyrosine-type recombinase/integrase [Magnetococcales bacterium]|nr:tyrosine-type recombinase/integrase [Magnetococcales bacterium]